MSVAVDLVYKCVSCVNLLQQLLAYKVQLLWKLEFMLTTHCLICWYAIYLQTVISHEVWIQ